MYHISPIGFLLVRELKYSSELFVSPLYEGPENLDDPTANVDWLLPAHRFFRSSGVLVSGFSVSENRTTRYRFSKGGCQVECFGEGGYQVECSLSSISSSSTNESRRRIVFQLCLTPLVQINFRTEGFRRVCSTMKALVGDSSFWCFKWDL